MNAPAISVHELGKRYMLGEVGLTRLLAGGLRKCLPPVKRKVPGDTAREDEFIWALRDVSFEVEAGEIVGIIGRNGAGKSTLLKILSRITRPTTGRAEIRGTVGSLLEVGTGFHQELTGRENIFLNGTILGMSRTSIRERLDQIVEFSGVERFLDTPVKRYSSGMYTRLAFSVAAHLDPDILLVDEVLAVGDATFQRKCLGRMSEVAQEGRTVLFVSHRMDIIRRLCHRAVLLEDGAVAYNGDCATAVERYLRDFKPHAAIADRGPAPEKQMHLRAAALLDGNGSQCSAFARGERADFLLTYEVNRPVEGAHVLVRVNNGDDQTIFASGDCDLDRSLFGLREPGMYRSRLALPTSLLNEGEYSITVSFSVPSGVIYDKLADVVRFSIHDSRRHGGPPYLQLRPGLVVQDLKWDTTHIESPGPGGPDGN